MPSAREAIDWQWQSCYPHIILKTVVIRQSIQSKCPEPPYCLESILTILVEGSVESVPNIISYFPHVIGKRSLKKSILLCQQGAFFVTESKLASVGSRMGKPLQGLHCKFHAKYCSALRDLFSWNYTLASTDLAFVPRWAIQQGDQIGKKCIFVETRWCVPGWAIHVYIYIYVFYLLTMIQESQHCGRNGVPR